MAFLPTMLRNLSSLTSSLFRGQNQVLVQTQHVRTKFVNARQMKDHKRRMLVKHMGEERLLLSTVYRCKILPPEIRDVAHQDVAALPRDSNYIRTVRRCYATSRPRAIISEFRVSRIVFRHLADYNKLSGVQRAMW